MSYDIRLEPFGLRFGCGEDETILQAAFRAGVNLRYGCRHGGCGACRTQLLSGDVDYAPGAGTAITEFDRQAGIALLCTAYPREDLTLALEGYEEGDLAPQYPPQDMTATLRARKMLTPDVLLLTFELAAGAQFSFAAGQYVEIAIPGTNAFRSYSCVNPPSRNDHVVCMVRLLRGGIFSTYIQAAPLGEQFRMRGPFGQCTLADTAADIIMVAGGTGLAPIASMLNQLADMRSRRSVRFYFGAKTRQDLFWSEEIEALGAILPNFLYIPVLEEGAVDQAWDGETGLVTEALERRESGLHRSEAYLCGSPGMIENATSTLRRLGMFSSRIRCDRFVVTG